jgi:hypothetical protein
LLTTFAIITTTATDDVGHIHDRMPMTVPPENREAWLDPRNDDTDRVRSLIAPPTPGSLDIYAISTAVHNVKNNFRPLLLSEVEALHAKGEPISLKDAARKLSRSTAATRELVATGTCRSFPARSRWSTWSTSRPSPTCTVNDQSAVPPGRPTNSTPSKQRTTLDSPAPT